MEYEWTSAKKAQGPADVATTANQATPDHDKSSGANTRRSSNTAAVPIATLPKAMAGPSPVSSHIPGMSSFSVNPEAAAPSVAPTRKRKAPGGAPAAQHAFPALAQASVGGSVRRHGVATNLQPVRTTTLMTFEDSQGYLINGRLKADDGTWLAIGGKHDSLPVLRMPTQIERLSWHGIINGG